mgnify:FL=1
MARSQNYDQNAHQAQMRILRALLMDSSKSFSDLQKATELSSDHANFHIKKLIDAGFVEHIKKEYGKYQLTHAGKEYANRMDTDEIVIEKQPKLSIVILLLNKQGKKLCQERLKQPYFGYWSHPTGKIRWGEEVLEAAARELMEETGLTATLAVRGIEHRIDHDHDGNLLEDKYFFIIDGTNPQGDMLEVTDGVRNFWVDIDTYNSHGKTFGMRNVHKRVHDRADAVFMENTFAFDPKDY